MLSHTETVFFPMLLSYCYASLLIMFFMYFNTHTVVFDVIHYTAKSIGVNITLPFASVVGSGISLSKPSSWTISIPVRPRMPVKWIFWHYYITFDI